MDGLEDVYVAEKRSAEAVETVCVQQHNTLLQSAVRKALDLLLFF